MDGFVSVIIPAYLCASTIDQAIESVLVQDVDLEVLVINDCSPDDLDAVMEKYSQNALVHYYKNETPLGAGGSRNRGVSLAKGDFVAFLDADDWWERGKLKKQLALMLSENGPVLTSTAREIATRDGKLTGRVIPVPEFITYRKLLLGNPINCSSVVLRTSVARQFPMEHEDSHEDYITWIRILRKYRTAKAVNEPLLKYRAGSTGKSGGKAKSAAKTYRAYRYAGFSRISSAALFIAYAVCGAAKYARAYIGGLFHKEEKNDSKTD